MRKDVPPLMSREELSTQYSDVDARLEFLWRTVCIRESACVVL